ncbi:DNA-directed RNA polymerase subunit delta [Paenibacillus sp. N1-5-1-14]|uniref:DNA-directed RNA polymerase subunit delta n=1 Tax=Paenibacillus radicibacter TaxID=2972488 RepID=UPI002158E719|nr:DNA-directed RNA polymerase subunit delta [Paenibacillus radicibacter]MCR8642567.1 DNA-directed RNA polymerase subunit delta [Paenibacillus radicibacter]
MSNPYTLKFSEDQAREMPMVDLAFELLKSANTPFYYRDLMQEIAKIKGMSSEQTMDVIAQLYTEINIDGRFACVGANLWGLKRWYPVEKGEDTVAGAAKRPRIINDEDDDDEDLFAEEEESYDAEGFDSFDSPRDEFESESETEEEEEEEESGFFGDEEIEEEEEIDEAVAGEGTDDEDSEDEEELDEEEADDK